jgi:uncharacterized protein (DUF58 family)
LIPREILQKVRRIEITTRSMVRDTFAGHYESIFKGRGMEFDEVREYQPGDDIRTIDWNVTARTGWLHVKKYVEERELTVLILFDASGSFDFGTSQRLKRGTDVARALEFAMRLVKRHSVMFCISDFRATGYENALTVANRKHDVVAITVTDPREIDIPPVGLIEVEDGETGLRTVLDVRSRAASETFRRVAAHDAEGRKGTFARAKVDQVALLTDRDYVEPLIKFFSDRERRFRWHY